MGFHKFVILLVILFLFLGTTFYLLIDSGVLDTITVPKISDIVHVFNKKEEIEETTESTEENEIQENENEINEEYVIEVTSE